MLTETAKKEIVNNLQTAIDPTEAVKVVRKDEMFKFKPPFLVVGFSHRGTHRKFTSNFVGHDTDNKMVFGYLDKEDVVVAVFIPRTQDRNVFDDYVRTVENTMNVQWPLLLKAYGGFIEYNYPVRQYKNIYKWSKKLYGCEISIPVFSWRHLDYSGVSEEAEIVNKIDGTMDEENGQNTITFEVEI